MIVGQFFPEFLYLRVPDVGNSKGEGVVLSFHEACWVHFEDGLGHVEVDKEFDIRIELVSRDIWVNESLHNLLTGIEVNLELVTRPHVFVQPT